MALSWSLFSGLLSGLLGAAVAFGQPIPPQPSPLDQSRIAAIVKAFNAMPSELTAPLTEKQVHLVGGEGRVDLNEEAKFSYLIQVTDTKDPKSDILLLPLATSRYAPTYYQTDAWWNAHQDEINKAKAAGLPEPHQDPSEVITWLKQMKLSTNPYMLVVTPGQPRAIPERLADYLEKFIIRNFSKDGMVTLYRGGQMAGELDSLKSGVKPRGMRYWTPTATYAWRYARKNQTFLQDLIAGRAPLFVFKVPLDEFKRLVEGYHPMLTLGAELTKNAHDDFDTTGVFQDHLYQDDYIGEGTLGAEIELRSNRAGADEMTRYFSHAITIEELAADRLEVIAKAQARLVKQFPDRAAAIIKDLATRTKNTIAERDLMVAIRDGKPAADIAKLRENLGEGVGEISYNDFESLADLSAPKIAQTKPTGGPKAGTKRAALAVSCSTAAESAGVELKP